MHQLHKCLEDIVWHDGHQALLERAMEKHGQVCLMIRNMETDENNPITHMT